MSVPYGARHSMHENMMKSIAASRDKENDYRDSIERSN